MSDTPRAPRDDELEELTEEVIVAQESAAHAPQRRTNVTTDHPSVVISEHGSGEPGERQRLPTMRTRRSEKTVIIRDRRKLDKMRRAISERHEPKQKPPLVERRTLYLLTAAAVGSLVVGSLIAALIDARKPNLEPVLSASAAPPPAPSASGPHIDTVELDALPVDKSRRHVSR